MGSQSETEWAAFEEKVRRTVFLDCLSPAVTEPVLRNALNQFGAVVNVEFIPNYLEPRNMPGCALVEMANSKQAKNVIQEILQFPFMMSGMPRPVRAHPAEPEMFETRPAKPGQRIHCRWLDPKDPDFETAKKLKRLTRKHAAETAFFWKQQLSQEEKLSKQQAETLKVNHFKYEMVDGAIGDGSARRLARHYGLKVADD